MNTQTTSLQLFQQAFSTYSHQLHKCTFSEEYEVKRHRQYSRHSKTCQNQIMIEK